MEGKEVQDELHKNCLLTLRIGKGKMTMVKATIKYYALSQNIGCPIL